MTDEVWVVIRRHRVEVPVSSKISSSNCAGCPSGPLSPPEAQVRTSTRSPGSRCHRRRTAAGSVICPDEDTLNDSTLATPDLHVVSCRHRQHIGRRRLETRDLVTTACSTSLTSRRTASCRVPQ